MNDEPFEKEVPFVMPKFELDEAETDELWQRFFDILDGKIPPLEIEMPTHWIDSDIDPFK